MSKRIIAVVGATGAQGGGLVRAILQHGDFAARAITRQPMTEKARVLAAGGAEVVAADLDDAESLRRAFDGAWGAFCVTNFWDHFSAPRETTQAKNLADAAAAAGVQHAVWSTLEDTRLKVPLDDDRMPTLHGTYKVPHFDAKGEADDHFRRAGVPTTFMLTSFYWENFLQPGLAPRRGDDGKLSFALPMADKRLPGVSSADIGLFAYGIFVRGESLIGQTVGVSGGHPTGDEMAAALSRGYGEPVAYQYIPPEVFRTFPFPGADDIANMFQYKRDFEESYCASRDLSLARSLAPGLQTFVDWVETNKAHLPRG